MNYKVSLTAYNKGNLYDCFEPETYKHKRSEFKLKKHEKDLKFDIKAEDSTALRATVNSIIKLFNVFEKVKKIE